MLLQQVRRRKQSVRLRLPLHLVLPAASRTAASHTEHSNAATVVTRVDYAGAQTLKPYSAGGRQSVVWLGSMIELPGRATDRPERWCEAEIV